MSKNLYVNCKNEYSKTINEFISNNCFFAFNQNQFEAGLKSLNIQNNEIKNKLVQIIGGGYMLKDKREEFNLLNNSYKQLIQEQIKLDQTGDGFIFGMFVYELEDHEYGYTGDDSDTLDALNLTIEDVLQNPALLNGLRRAKTYVQSLDL